jgi:hypothetical protein
MSYSLENIWTFSDQETQQILTYFNNPIFNDIKDKLNAIILSFNNGLLINTDRDYVVSPLFNQLFSATDDELKISSNRSDLDHIQMVKFVIDFFNIPIVTSLPSSTIGVNIYQMGDAIYICGKGTYQIRDQLKDLKATWNPSQNCWSLPISQKEKAMEIKYPKVVIAYSSQITVVNSIPKVIPYDLQVYQIRDRIYACGRETIKIKNELIALRSGIFEDRCWNFPLYEANHILEIVNRYRAKLADEPNRLKRLQIPESEAYYEPYSGISRTYIFTNPTMRDNDLTLDLNQLKPLWENKIHRTEGNTYHTYTYDGDIKPPELAFVFAADRWKIPIFGWNVTRVDYKKYEVRVYTD